MDKTAIELEQIEARLRGGRGSFGARTSSPGSQDLNNGWEEVELSPGPSNGWSGTIMFVVLVLVVFAGVAGAVIYFPF